MDERTLTSLAEAHLSDVPRRRLGRVNDIARLIEAQCARMADFEALTVVEVAPDGCFRDERRTYAQLRDNGRRLALLLQRQGIGEGDHVVIMLQNHPEFVEVMIAAAYLGATFVPVDPRSMGEKLAYMLNFVEAKTVIAGSYAVEALVQVANALSVTRDVLLVGVDEAPLASKLRCQSYDAALPTSSEGLVTVEPDQRSPMFMMFTSGTTGNPKAVVRCHLEYMKTRKGLTFLGVEAGDTLYTGLPLCHVNAHSTLATGLSLGLRTVLSRRFTKSRLWDICRAYSCTVFTLLGGMIPELFAVPERPDDADNPVRLLISSGMPAELWEAFERRFGVVITEVYGSTEAGGTLINLKGEGPKGSMGKPPPGMEAAIFDTDGNACAPFVPGELCFRMVTGAASNVAYFQNEKASEEKTKGGWFRSGDIAHRDGDGWFYFRYRAGGGVRRNGDFVNTALVETVLVRSPLVEDVYVYGVPTPANVAGEKTLVAAVVVAEGGDVEAVRDWAAGHLQKNEVPEIWQRLDAIPKTVSEKPIEHACIGLLKEAGLAEVSHDD